MNVEVELESRRSSSSIERVSTRYRVAKPDEGCIESPMILLVSLGNAGCHRFQSREDRELFSVSVPIKNFVEESEPFHSCLKARLSTCRIKRCRVDQTHV